MEDKAKRVRELENQLYHCRLRVESAESRLNIMALAATQGSEKRLETALRHMGQVEKILKALKEKSRRCCGNCGKRKGCSKLRLIQDAVGTTEKKRAKVLRNNACEEFDFPSPCDGCKVLSCVGCEHVTKEMAPCVKDPASCECDSCAGCAFEEVAGAPKDQEAAHGSA
jgi:hypothetical protein